MATKRKNTAKSAAKNSSSQTVTRVERVDAQKEQSLFERLSESFQKNQSFFNIVLGGLIVVVLAVLLFNYFNQPAEDLAGPASQTEETQPEGDVAKTALPGTYTVKEGDTLFTIAQSYYDDGFKYPELVKANGLANENAIAAGQEITIPKLSESGQAVAMASASPTATSESSAMASAEPTTEPSAMAQATPAPAMEATGGAENATAWGDKITADTYTVQAGDWLSKIAGRAYGDVYAYQKIAQANNITNPDAIEVGMTLKIPR
jgi:nucleoid-associated protein YgaU